MATVVLGPLPVIAFADLRMPTYNVVISLILCIVVWYVNFRAVKKQYSGTTAMDLCLITLVAGSVGARLLHVFYEAPDHYLKNPMEVFYFWQGGFVFYGGILSGIFAGWITLKIKQQSFPMWADFFAPVVSLGYALGRLACFLTGCCYGRICDLPWAYPFREIDTVTGAMTVLHRHPTQLYAFFIELLILGLVLILEKRKYMANKAGCLFALWLALHSLGRIFMEVFRDDDRGPVLGALSVSTLLSLIFLFLSALYLFQRRAFSGAHSRPLSKV